MRTGRVTICRPKHGPALQATGHVIKPCRFAVLRDDEVHGWLGASPDGLIDSLTAEPGSAAIVALASAAVPCMLLCGYCSGCKQVLSAFTQGRLHWDTMLRLTWLSAASPNALAAGMGPGVLEIKCPFNRGQPESASIPSLPPWYYMPQVCLHRRWVTLARHSVLPLHLLACTQGGFRLL